MIKEIIMPKLGETMEEGYLVSWKKEEGEKDWLCLSRG